MRVGAKLEEWHAVGLIDAATAAAIRAHEERGHRSVGWFAITGLGALALALGVLSVVAANWDALPDAAKLAGHLLLTAAAALAAYRFTATGSTRAGDVALFLLAALVLGGVALHAQVYQQSGPLWQALAWWAVLSAPALLLLGRTRLTALGLGVMLMALAVACLAGGAGWWGETLSAALPPGLVLLALLLPPREDGEGFRAALFGLGIVLTLAAATLAHLGWVFPVSAGDAARVWARAAVPALCVAGACALAFRERTAADARLIAMTLTGGLVAGLLALGVPHSEGVGWRMIGVLSFLLLWGGVAALAVRAGWHGLFRVAVGAVAIRVLLIYFELFYSLAFTGVGLIVAGLLTLALAWGWSRIVRREEA